VAQHRGAQLSPGAPCRGQPPIWAMSHAEAHRFTEQPLQLRRGPGDHARDVEEGRHRRSLQLRQFLRAEADTLRRCEGSTVRHLVKRTQLLLTQNMALPAAETMATVSARVALLLQLCAVGRCQRQSAD